MTFLGKEFRYFRTHAAAIFQTLGNPRKNRSYLRKLSSTWFLSSRVSSDLSIYRLPLSFEAWGLAKNWNVYWFYWVCPDFCLWSVSEQIAHSKVLLKWMCGRGNHPFFSSWVWAGDCIDYLLLRHVGVNPTSSYLWPTKISLSLRCQWPAKML